MGENYTYNYPVINNSQISYNGYYTAGNNTFNETNVGYREPTPDYDQSSYDSSSTTPLSPWRDSNPYFGLHEQYPTTAGPNDEKSINTQANSSNE